MVQNFPNSNDQTQKEPKFSISNLAVVLDIRALTKMTIGYAVITNDIATSNLNAVTSFGLVIVVITTKARAAERSLNHVTRGC